MSEVIFGRCNHCMPSERQRAERHVTCARQAGSRDRREQIECRLRGTEQRVARLMHGRMSSGSDDSERRARVQACRPIAQHHEAVPTPVRHDCVHDKAPDGGSFVSRQPDRGWLQLQSQLSEAGPVSSSFRWLDRPASLEHPPSLRPPRSSAVADGCCASSKPPLGCGREPAARTFWVDHAQARRGGPCRLPRPSDPRGFSLDGGGRRSVGERRGDGTRSPLGGLHDRSQDEVGEHSLVAWPPVACSPGPNRVCFG